MGKEVLIYNGKPVTLFTEATDLAAYLNPEVLKRKFGVTEVKYLMDENTEVHCYALIKKNNAEALGWNNSHEISIQSGEENKNLDTCSAIWKAMAGMDRKSLLVNLGGGVIGDMGGFAASLFKRGIRFINVPTTLLSQVDASVGGKLGIDFEGFKNYIGVFNDPEEVLIFPDFMKTLELKEVYSGFAEILKHALIKDADYWNVLKNTIQNEYTNQESLKVIFDWNTIIETSIKIKAAVVVNDPFEAGERRILNFGHTVGHAIESWLLANGRKEPHGHCIIAGMICEAYISTKLGYLSADALKEIEDTFNLLYPKLSLSSEALGAITALTFHDKKNENEEVLCALIDKIGHCLEKEKVSFELISESLSYYINGSNRI
jgi:3-dehydroquinate synthase